MSLSLVIRRWCYGISSRRTVRSRRQWMFFLTIAVFISIVVVIRRRETCWLDSYRSRLFCFVLTNQENLDSRARATYETWGQRCGKFVLITRLNSSRSYTIFDHQGITSDNKQLPIQYIPTLPDETYSHLPDKVRAALLFFNEHYSNYDWYLKADDDTYVIVENLLRFLVSTKKRSPRPLMYGYRFREDYYVSGGSGYVLTREALRLFGSHMHSNQMYALCNSSMEDMMVGLCLQKVFDFVPSKQMKDLTLVGETIDEQGRERFHPLSFRLHFNGPSNKTKREWIHFRPLHHNVFGYEALSETTISFHYTVPEDMYQIHILLYGIRRFDQQVCQV